MVDVPILDVNMCCSKWKLEMLLWSFRLRVHFDSIKMHHVFELAFPCSDGYESKAWYPSVKTPK